MTTLDPSIQSLLRARAEALEQRSQGLFRFRGELVFGVPQKVVRAYVWASHQGHDVAEACAHAWFGRDVVAASLTRVGKAWAHRLNTLEARR